jgi:hypothetical protein
MKMKNKITRLKLDQIDDLDDNKLCEIAQSWGINILSAAQELEQGKYFLRDREKVIELLEKRWRDVRTEESITIAKRAFLISILAALAAIASAIAAFI